MVRHCYSQTGIGGTKTIPASSEPRLFVPTARASPPALCPPPHVSCACVFPSPCFPSVRHFRSPTCQQFPTLPPHLILPHDHTSHPKMPCAFIRHQCQLLDEKALKKIRPWRTLTMREG